MKEEDISPWAQDEAAAEKSGIPVLHSTVQGAGKREVPDFLKDKKNVIVPCAENLLRAVQWMYFDNFRFNIWTNRRETNIGKGTWRAVSDHDYMEVHSSIEKKFEDKAIRCASLRAVTDALQHHCYNNSVDPAKEFFLDLAGEWDGVPRIDEWLIRTYHTPDTLYYRAVGSNFLKGLVRRVVVPYTKFDTVIVLEGAQGIGKSTSLELLGGEWHTAITIAPDNKDFFMAMQGHMIVEFSEGETLSRSEVKQLKSVISNLVDTYRPPYGREVINTPRRCVFAMTTNQDTYLKDETGNRRWLPVACEGKVDLEWLRENKTQLFAEAVTRVLDKQEPIYEFPEEETRAMQESRLVEDPDREKVSDWYFFKLTEGQRQEGITTEQAYQAIQPELGYMRYEKMKRHDQMRVGSILRETLYLDKKRPQENNSRAYRYYPSPKTIDIAPKDIPSDIKEFLEL